MSHEILCVGEILWDALPEGLFLGGAPYNVARHLHGLGEEVTFVSRVGDDVLGDEALRRVRASGLNADFIQVDKSLPTGFVRVALDDTTGEPDYEIVEPAAWDAITLTARLRNTRREVDAVVFGSLAQRADTSRETVRRLLGTDALHVFDVNLRPPFVDREVVATSLKAADVVKLNDGELAQLVDWFAEGEETMNTAMAALATQFNCTALCVTCGGEGARLWRNGAHAHHSGYAVNVTDTVGAGDAFLAALLVGLLDDWESADLLTLANRLGGFVASHSGAFPPYTVKTLEDIKDLPLDGDGD